MVAGPSSSVLLINIVAAFYIFSLNFSTRDFGLNIGANFTNSATVLC